MKKFVFCAVSALLVSFISVPCASAETTTGAGLEFESVLCDFGDVPNSSRDLEYEFKFTNTGDSPLVILNVITSCSCLKAHFSRKPVAAGANGRLRIVFEPRKMPAGVFRRVLQIRSNSSAGVSQVVVRGNIVGE